VGRELIRTCQDACESRSLGARRRRGLNPELPLKAPSPPRATGSRPNSWRINFSIFSRLAAAASRKKLRRKWGLKERKNTQKNTFVCKNSWGLNSPVGKKCTGVQVAPQCSRVRLHLENQGFKIQQMGTFVPTHTHTHTQTAGVSLSPRIEGSLHSSFSSSADVEKLVALVYRQQDARLRRIAGSRMQRTVTLVIQAWR